MKGRVNRRQFISSAGVGAGAATLGSLEPAARASGKPVLMKLGCQTAPTNDTHLKYLARYGVRNICGYAQNAAGGPYPTREELQQMHDLAEIGRAHV